MSYKYEYSELIRERSRLEIAKTLPQICGVCLQFIVEDIARIDKRLNEIDKLTNGVIV